MPREKLTLKNVYQYMVKYDDFSQKLELLDLLMQKVKETEEDQ